LNKLTVKDVVVSGKRVLIRVDFNVPLDEKSGAITDDSRIRATLPTIKYLIEQEAKVILASHLGRPKGQVVDKLRLTVVAQRLSQLLGQQVGVTKDCIGTEVQKSIESLVNGNVLLLENLRFHADEAKNNPDFARALAKLADIYVNDAFGASHRSHASIVGIAEYLPAVAGLLLERELNNLGAILENPARPFAAVLGGAKVSDKVGMLENIMAKVDYLLIGGGMAATFLKASSCQVGKSLVEADRLDTASILMNKAASNGVKLVLPLDVVVAKEISAEAEVKVVAIEEVPSDWSIMDIGPKTVESFHDKLRRCKTVFWNGPMGIYEIPQFAKGTQAIAKLLASINATTIMGGGSTAEVVTELGLTDKMSFVSTGGGASLRFLGGQQLPGVGVLLDKKG